MDNLKIWLIDDDISYNYMNEKLISNYNKEYIETTTFTDARKVISLIEENSDLPNLIFLDWHMPEYSGEDFLKDFIVLNIKQNIKIIVITSTDYINDIEIINTYNLKYLPKPLVISDLEDILGKKDKFNSIKNMLKFLSK